MYLLAYTARRRRLTDLDICTPRPATPRRASSHDSLSKEQQSVPSRLGKRHPVL